MPRTNQRDYIHIVKGSGCSSSVGRVGRGQQVSLGRGCVYKGIVEHEFMHALGNFDPIITAVCRPGGVGAGGLLLGQHVSLGWGCVYKGIVEHEFMHALGNLNIF